MCPQWFREKMMLRLCLFDLIKVYACTYPEIVLTWKTTVAEAYKQRFRLLVQKLSILSGKQGDSNPKRRPKRLGEESPVFAGSRPETGQKWHQSHCAAQQPSRLPRADLPHGRRARPGGHFRGQHHLRRQASARQPAHPRPDLLPLLPHHQGTRVQHAPPGRDFRETHPPDRLRETDGRKGASRGGVREDGGHRRDRQHPPRAGPATPGPGPPHSFHAHRTGAQLQKLQHGPASRQRCGLRNRLGTDAQVRGPVDFRLHRFRERLAGLAGGFPGDAARVRLAGAAEEGRRTREHEEGVRLRGAEEALLGEG